MSEKPKHILVVGGGPAGLYFSVLTKLQNPNARITVCERNQRDETFGFGVVFSDETLSNIEHADPETYGRIVQNFAHWDDIDIHFHNQHFRSRGHGFAGLSRKRLLQLLADRCEEVGVELLFGTEMAASTDFSSYDLVVAADGLNSQIRNRFADSFRPTVDRRPNRFTWLGTTCQFPAFTFIFKENEHGMWRVHAYNFEDGLSTFIIETTEQVWRNAGMDTATEDETVRYCEALFKDELQGHSLIKNHSIWRQFPTVKNECWAHENIVLLGDAAHTAHFSIGSGTKMAMEDAIELSRALEEAKDTKMAIRDYETNRRKAVESTQRAAQVSLEWFENTELLLEQLEPEAFAFSLLTRSLRISHENLKVRDPAFVTALDGWYAQQHECPPDTPPMFTPFSLRSLTLTNRVVVSPMCMYSAEDGTPNDFHLVHLGSRAIGGAGLIMTEMTNVTRDGRITPGCTGLYKNEHVSAWKRIVNFVHENSGAAIGIQLGHAGRRGATRQPWFGQDVPLETGGWPVWAPSAQPFSQNNQVPIELDMANLDRIRDAFVTATQRADEAGFDMLELHCAHGYLLHSFLSPITNQRNDRYGGTLENRMRYPLEIFRCMRAVWPHQKPMAVRISATDWISGGWQIDDSIAFATALASAGCDIIDVSSGQLGPESRPQYGRLYQTGFSEQIRLSTGMPTMTVGNISSYADCNSVLLAGRADLCVIARAHLFDPYWTRHAAFEQEQDKLQWPKQYGTMERYTPRLDWSKRN